MYQFLDTNDSLVSPLESADTMDYILFPFSSEQFVCTEKMDLQKLAAVVCSCFSILFLV